MTQRQTAWVSRLRPLVLVLFGALPLVFHGSVEEHIYLRVPYLLALATCVWVAAGARGLLTSWVPPRPPLVVPGAAWLLLGAFSMYWALSPQLVPVALFRDLVIMSAAGAFAMMAAPRRGLALVLLGAGAFAALGLTLIDYHVLEDHYRWRPFFQSSLAGDFAAAAFAGTFSALACGVPRNRGGKALALGGLLLLSVAALTLWDSKALTATGAAAAGCVAGFLTTRGVWGRRLMLLVPVAALIAGGAILYYFGVVLHHPSGEIRFLLWEGAWNMLRESPLGGVGYGGFGAAFPLHRPDGYWDALYATTWSPHAHSLYLEMAATLGIPGLIVATSFVPVALVGGARLAAAAESEGELAVSAAIVGAFCAVAVAALADLAVEYPLGRFMFFALAGLAYSRTAREDVEGGRSIDLLLRRGLLVAVAIMLLLQCLFVERDLVNSRIAYRRATVLQAESEVARHALDSLPAGASDLERAGATGKLRAAIRRSLTEFDRAVDLPRFETQWTLRGRLLIASLVTQLASMDPDPRDRDTLYLHAKNRCAQVERIATDFEDNELLYAIIEFEMGRRESFASHLQNYYERRIGWDLRADVPGQRAPKAPAWAFVLDRVPPSDPVFSWVRTRIEQRATVEAQNVQEGGHGAQMQAARVAELFRVRAEGE